MFYGPICCTVDHPEHLHVPQFTYSAVASQNLEVHMSQREDVNKNEEGERFGMEHFSQPFDFSALFQSSQSLPGASILRGTPKNAHPPTTHNPALDSFIGFSWGPRLKAFNPHYLPAHETTSPARPPLHREPVNLTPRPSIPSGTLSTLPLPQTDTKGQEFRTPVRTNSVPLMLHDGHAISAPRTGTVRRMQGERPLSDREAMQQLVDCVGMSARKKVLESGKKPVHIRTSSGRWGTKKDIKRFAPSSKPLVINTRMKGDMSTTTSESESQPPSPTPRPGSALSRRSGWGGRSTPSLVAGRSTPTLTFTATGTGAGVTGSGNLTRNSLSSGVWPESSRRRTISFDEKLRDAERRHDRLLDELATLEKDIGTVALHLKGT